MVIISKDNSKIKEAASLKDKKAREELGKYLIEGYRSVKDSIEFLINPTLFMSESAFSRFVTEFEGYNCVICTDAVFSKLADTENSQGVACVADIKRSIPSYEGKLALFLDRIRDPGNLGTIIRTALAVGFNDIFCYNCVDAYNPKVVRSTTSALSRVNIYEVSSLNAAITLKQNGYKLFCADMNGENVFNSSYTFDKICLAVGNEANGLSEEIILLADKTISLPMNAVESLNAAVSAAVVMYQLAYGGNNIK